MNKKDGLTSPKNKRWLQSAERTAKVIESYRDKMKQKTDDELREYASDLKARGKKGEGLNKLLPEAFALVREASRRVTGMEPYHVQLLGGIALHEGKIAEMRTGEGKTLVAVLPSFLNALEGKGVHVVTVNDYLAQRDAENMGRIHAFLGMTVGVITQRSTQAQRKAAYACDITYVTNSELGFDYLRDNGASSLENTVLRGLNYCIIDEADSILIDEARTPLIISGEGSDVSKLYLACDALAKKMTRGEFHEFSKIDAIAGEQVKETGDFMIDEKDKLAILTDAGIAKVEEHFKVEDYASEKNIALHHIMDLALRANYVMKKDKDYIVKNGEVMIVDEFTGRIMPGREYSDGLHQAIEAKENVRVRRESKTIAAITYQCFFDKYKKKAGMTGTGYSSRKEFRETYRMGTVVIPTNEPVRRIDHADVIYLTQAGKFSGIVDQIRRSHEKGQPVLVGTASVEVSEYLHKLLRKEGLKHQVLNAKQDRREADIIAEAGKYGAITVATNMAGRGTDIILDDKAREAGGLMVIGTERHEARRIDDQLRGRSGRQGDPGESVFYVSAEDPIMRLYMPEKMREALVRAADGHEDIPMDYKMFGRSIRRAQTNIENNNYGIRKNVLDYDRINDRQRDLVYKARRMLLEHTDCSNQMKDMILACVRYIQENGAAEEYIQELFPLNDRDKEQLKKMKPKTAKLQEMAMEKYDERKQFLGEECHQLERFSMLSAIDTGWTEQLAALDYQKQTAGYAAYAQNDPKTMYALDAHRIYDQMKMKIHMMAVHEFFFAKPQRKAVFSIKV